MFRIDWVIRMPAPYDARTIANYILKAFDSIEHSLTNKKINKLLYFVQGASLVRLNRELIRNHFEAWSHGPVVNVIYQSFKDFERNPITGLATAFDYELAKEVVVSAEGIDEYEKEFIHKVCQHFIRYTADELETMSHEPSGPWDTVRSTAEADRGLRGRIPLELMRHHFAKKYGDRRTLQ